jgi:hypothetical protein
MIKQSFRVKVGSWISNMELESKVESGSDRQLAGQESQASFALLSLAS